MPVIIVIHEVKKGARKMMITSGNSKGTCIGSYWCQGKHYDSSRTMHREREGGRARRLLVGLHSCC